MNLLDGVCPEVIEMLKDREFSAWISKILRRMESTRQIECAELMVSTDNFAITYARALFAATSQEMLVNPKGTSASHAGTQEQITKIEREIANLHERYRIVEQSYGDDVLSLSLVRRYTKKLIENEAVVSFLKRKYPEFLQEFSSLGNAVALDQ